MSPTSRFSLLAKASMLTREVVVKNLIFVSVKESVLLILQDENYEALLDWIDGWILQRRNLATEGIGHQIILR